MFVAYLEESSESTERLYAPIESSVHESPKTPSSPSFEEAPPEFSSDEHVESLEPLLPELPAAQEPLISPGFSLDSAGEVVVDTSVYREIFSVSTLDKKYFAVDFGFGNPTLNPNIIPHPHEENTWIIIAQKEQSAAETHEVFEELACNAVFREDGSLVCSTLPRPLPVAPTRSDNCKGELEAFNLPAGPHDMRVSYGPDAPFAVYGSQSQWACFGLWAQDFRSLASDDFQLDTLNANLFANAAELQRPQPWHEVEKNWFLFWDTQGAPYVHHDIEPKRAFAQVLPDGSVGPDLAPAVAAGDDACMAKYMPKIAPVDENLHQATNSLSITLCKRSEEACQPNDENTFIISIFQVKKYHSWHGVYEPYVMLFQRNAPFALHAISTKPLWIHGRRPLTKDTAGLATKWDGDESKLPKDQSEMFYVTSMSWKSHGQRYHGYADDVLFLGFGVEDERSAAIDVLAGNLLLDMGLCLDGEGMRFGPA
jgi:hypothetical protein